jgi:DNA-binding transcriptional LysR family regulator
MTRAAAALHLTPPAVSMQIKEAQSQVGLTFVDRQGRTVSLSTAAEYFLVHARRLRVALKDADDELAHFRKLESGLLNVGLVNTTQYFVPRLLTRIREEHPGVEWRLRVGSIREDRVTLLQHGEVDLAIMGRPPKEMAMCAEPFAAHPHVFVAPPGHPILATANCRVLPWPAGR